MGIPFLISAWLKPKGYIGTLQNRLPANVSTLCLDANGIFHNSVHLCYEKFPEVTDPRDLEKEIFNQIGIKILEIVRKVNPIDYLIIAVDGVAVFAKFQQQRQRRFLSSINNVKEAFNRNSISPGTTFMDNLDNYLQKFISNNQTKLCQKIIYSSHRVEGEAENKIYTMIRDKPEIFDRKKTMVIYGADADLIMFSMLSPVENIYILRDNFDDIINIGKLRSAIQSELNNPDISDFIIMMFLLGNDFLPKSPAFPSPATIDDLFHIYRQLSLKLSIKEEDGSIRINWNNLTKFFSLISTKEAKILASLPATKYPSRMVKVATENGPFNFDLFRSAWYTNALFPKKDNPLFPVDVEQEDLEEMMSSYLEGMAWIIRYYTKGTFGVNHLYSYKYFHCPLFTDLADYMTDQDLSFLDEKVKSLDSQDFDQDNFGPGEMIKRFQSREYFGQEVPNKIAKTDFYPITRYPSILHQLLVVLPPGSESLVPYEIQGLFPREKFLSPLEDNFPFKFEIEFDGVNKEHEGIAIVPPVDPEAVYSVINNILISSERQQLLFAKRENILFEQSKSMIRNNLMKNRINEIIAQNRNQRFKFKR